MDDAALTDLIAPGALLGLPAWVAYHHPGPYRKIVPWTVAGGFLAFAVLWAFDLGIGSALRAVQEFIPTDARTRARETAKAGEFLTGWRILAGSGYLIYLHVLCLLEFLGIVHKQAGQSD